jgi:hypothetical protein
MTSADLRDEGCWCESYCVYGTNRILIVHTVRNVNKTMVSYALKSEYKIRQKMHFSKILFALNETFFLKNIQYTTGSVHSTSWE